MVKNNILWIILLTVGCLSQKKDSNLEKQILGSWQTCNKDSLYIELHFKPEQIIYCPSFEPLGIYYAYEIQNDSLFILDHMDSFHLNEAKVVSKGENKMELQFEKGSMLLEKLEKDVVVPQIYLDSNRYSDYQKRHLLYQKLYELRQNSYGCTKNIFEDIKENDSVDLDLNLDDIDTDF